MSQTGFSNSLSAQHDKEGNEEESGQTVACSTSQRRKPRAQTKWPSDNIKVIGIYGDGFQTNDDSLKWWRLICGLIARQRVGINVKFEDVNEPVRLSLFKIMKEYLEFPKGTSEAQMNRVRGVAWKPIAKLHRHFKSNLVRNFVNQPSSHSILQVFPSIFNTTNRVICTGINRYQTDLSTLLYTFIWVRLR